MTVPFEAYEARSTAIGCWYPVSRRTSRAVGADWAHVCTATRRTAVSVNSPSLIWYVTDAVPARPGIASKKMLLDPATDAVPSDGSGAPTIDRVSGSPSGSESFSRTGVVTDPPFTTLAESSDATGGRFSGGRTTRENVDVARSPSPSLIV